MTRSWAAVSGCDRSRAACAAATSPFIGANTRNDTPYNRYSLLCSLENPFALPKLGDAAQAGLPCFGTDVCSRPA